MLERYEIENIEQLRAVADTLRLRIIDTLSKQPMTVTQIGETLGEAPAKMHYHVRELEKVGLLRLVETREKGGILEKYYQPIARELSVERSLLSAPPEEAIATLSGLLTQMRDNFLQAFRRNLEQQVEQPDIGVGFSRLYITLEEQKQLSKRLGDLFKSYEQPRGIEGEREMLVTIMAYPELAATTSLPMPSSSTQNTQAVGTVTYSRADLEKALAEGRRLNIQVVGICSFADDVSPELAERAVAYVRVVGKLFASPDVSEVLMKKRDDK
ncbi:MAG: hypothetical protein NVS3B14_01210 [Ktedonobacteraceae bacterium]